MTLVFSDDTHGSKRCSSASPDRVPPTRVDYTYTLRTRAVRGTLSLTWLDADRARVVWREQLSDGAASGTGELSRAYGNDFRGRYEGDFCGSWNLFW